MNTFKYALSMSQEKVQNTIFLLQYSNLSIVKDMCNLEKGSIFNLYAFIIYTHYIYVYIYIMENYLEVHSFVKCIGKSVG